MTDRSNASPAPVRGRKDSPRGQGAPRREPVRYAPDIAEAILAAVTAGDSLSAVAARPGMPSAPTIRAWAATWPDFGQALAAARQATVATRRLAQRAADDARRARPQHPNQRKTTFTEALGAEICERLANGESLTAICRSDHMPWPATVYDWLRDHRDFEDAYVEARRRQAETLFDEARDVGHAATPKTVWVGRLRFDIIRWQAALLAPQKYSERIAVLEAQLAAEKAAREAADPSMTVVIKRFTDPPEGYEGGLALEPGEERVLYTMPMVK